MQGTPECYVQIVFQQEAFLTKKCPVIVQVHPVWNFQISIGIPSQLSHEDFLFLTVFTGLG
jgi:hypothetical protein